MMDGGYIPLTVEQEPSAMLYAAMVLVTQTRHPLSHNLPMNTSLNRYQESGMQRTHYEMYTPGARTASSIILLLLALGHPQILPFIRRSCL